MKVRCVNVGSIKEGGVLGKNCLTLGKYYDVIEEGAEHYQIIDDLGFSSGFYKERFETKEERFKQLIKLYEANLQSKNRK